MLRNLLRTIMFAAVFLHCEVLSAAEIIIKGNQRLSTEEVTSYLNVSGLKKKSDSALQESLKNLYASDLFLEAKINYQGKDILVDIVESPLISEVKFVGNKKIEDELLQNEISLKKREIFSKAKLESDLKRINEIYLKSGRFLTQIEPKIIQKEQNRIELVFDINEGPKAEVTEIYFVGNQAFSDQELADEISTKESQWWKFLSSSDLYDSDRIEFDREKLRRFYTARGYADFTTISAIAQINAQKDSFFVTFLLEEGLKYNFGKINLINKIEKFDIEVLQKEILVEEGDVYNSELLIKTIEKMVEVMSDKSYAFADIEPVLKRNKETKTIDVDFVVAQTPRIYINDIIISGNVRTKDEVIRREMRVREGDPYNITRINRSKQRLENLGFFEKVDFETKRVGQTDKVDLVINVKEKKTGEVNLGVGYSTVNRLTMNAGIKENNLFGTGQQLGLNVQRSFANVSADVSYTKPYFLGREIDVGFDLFRYDIQRRNTLTYNQSSQGITFRGNYAITEFLGHQIRYSYSSQDVNNVESTASLTIQSLKGQFDSSAVGQSFTYDRRDNRLNPKSGYFLTISQDYTGLGGDIKTLKHEGSAGVYIPTFNDDFILKFLARGGVIDGIGQDVRSNYGFFLGGNNFRGFEYAGIGPRAIVNGSAVGGDIVGGNIYYVGTVEFMFPLGLPKDLGINGILFSDNGTVKGVDSITTNFGPIADTGSIRSSYGISIAWASPMGPIRLDFSRVAKRENFDQTQNFRFSFGTTF